MEMYVPGLLAFRRIESQYRIPAEKLAKQFASQDTEPGVDERTAR